MTLEEACDLARVVERIPPERRTVLEQAAIVLATAWRDAVAFAGEPEIRHSSVMESETGSPSLSSGVTSDVNT
jgi:hypothetical protein